MLHRARRQLQALAFVYCEDGAGRRATANAHARRSTTHRQGGDRDQDRLELGVREGQRRRHLAK